MSAATERYAVRALIMGADQYTRRGTCHRRVESMRPTTIDRAMRFCDTYRLRCPVLLAPMAGASPATLSIAVANAGGMGAMGALLTPSDGIRAWVEEFRSQSDGPFQLNLWIPDPPPHRDAHAEARIRTFLEQWGPPVPAS